MPSYAQINASFDADQARPELAAEQDEVVQVLAATQEQVRQRRGPLRPGRFLEPSHTGALPAFQRPAPGGMIPPEE